jgi:hypothetical protein
MSAYRVWRSCLSMLGFVAADPEPTAPPAPVITQENVRTYRDVLLTPTSKVSRDSFSEGYVIVSV